MQATFSLLFICYICVPNVTKRANRARVRSDPRCPVLPPVRARGKRSAHLWRLLRGDLPGMWYAAGIPGRTRHRITRPTGKDSAAKTISWMGPLLRKPTRPQTYPQAYSPDLMQARVCVADNFGNLIRPLGWRAEFHLNRKNVTGGKLVVRQRVFESPSFGKRR